MKIKGILEAKFRIYMYFFLTSELIAEEFMLVSVKESSLNASKIYSTSVNSSLEPGLKLALCIRKEAISSMAKIRQLFFLLH